MGGAREGLSNARTSAYSEDSSSHKHHVVCIHVHVHLHVIWNTFVDQRTKYKLVLSFCHMFKETKHGSWSNKKKKRRKKK